MSLDQLDAFLAHARQDPALDRRLHDHEDPLDLAGFLDLARGAGFSVAEADVLAAQQRQEESLSDEELQRQAGAEERRLRNFIMS